MTDHRELLKQALEEWRDNPGSVRMASLMMALEAALAEPEQDTANTAAVKGNLRMKFFNQENQND